MTRSRAKACRQKATLETSCKMDDETLDIEAALSEALDAGKPQIETPEPVETAEEKAAREYQRDEAGRFAAKQQEEQAQPDPAAQPQQQAKQPWKPLWYKDEYGDWQKLPEGFRKTLEQRETESAQAITKHSMAAKSWEPVLKEFEPYKQHLQQAGITEQQYVGQLVQADKFLREDPVAAINWIAQQYCGVDLYGLANYAYDNQFQPAAQPDPMAQQIAALQQQIQQLQQRPDQERLAAEQAQIQAWAKDKPHFEDVRGYMHALSQRPDYAEATLDELYEAAMYAHPQLRQRILADQRKAEVDRARSHSTGTRNGVGNGAAVKPPKMSLEEELAMHLDGRA